MADIMAEFRGSIVCSPDKGERAAERQTTEAGSLFRQEMDWKTSAFNLGRE